VNLALSIERQGRHTEAERLYREVLVVMQSVLGPEHPDTLRCMHNLAVVIFDQGRHTESERLFQDVLEVQRRVLGPDHPTTELTMKNLARVCADLSWLRATVRDPAKRNPDEAVQFAETATELQPQEANNWANLGVAHYRAGNWQTAADALEKARRMQRGEDPVHQVFLAMTYWQLGRPEAAVQEYVEAAQWLEKLRGSETPNRFPQQEQFQQEAEELMAIDASTRKSIIEKHLDSSATNSESPPRKEAPSNE
jgi:tetratricopeptide (TPR) repeat protein